VGFALSLRAANVAGWAPEQIIIGSAAFREGKLNLPFLRQLAKKLDSSAHRDRPDTAKGHMSRKAGVAPSNFARKDVMAQLQPFCAAFCVTDVDREGHLTGVNLKWFRELRKATDHPIIVLVESKRGREVSALEKKSAWTPRRDGSIKKLSYVESAV